MKKIFLFISVFSIASLYHLLTDFKVERVVNTNSKNVIEQEKVREVTALPKEILIPKISVETRIEQVGLDEMGRMDVPKDENQVGWYKYGVMPGKMGSAVLAGHLDSKTGPAIFYNLSSLDKGDNIQIIDENNKLYEFVVIDKKVYKNDNFPVKEVFTVNSRIGLNLITCHGTYNKNKLTYDERLVIYAELKT